MRGSRLYQFSINRFLVVGMLLMLLVSCAGDKNKPSLFEILDHNRTGLHFANTLTPKKEFNMFNYMYFYNGAGTGAGDFNNDGLIDLFFSSNQGDNKLYLNKGGLSFTDATVAAKIPQDGGWSTGVSVVDINNDDLLDIYVCKVGRYEVLNSKNQLLICKGIDANGIPAYADEAAKYGIDFSGLSTQALFFDYDMDGDLDMFLLNHAVHQNGSFAPRGNFRGSYSQLSGDHIYQNNGEKFVEVTMQTGINSSVISYGLGVVTSDINLDGWPDLYAGNDFHENDYLYINQKNGTFSEETEKRLMHTSKYTMGVDIADINNDGYPEIISTDMLPYDARILKSSLGDDDYDVFYQKIYAGYNYQYSRNNLQFNRRNGMFSEVGLYSGIYATDWSWAPLWLDIDNDGLKDLFISNGIPKRLNDMDYINFISNIEIQQMLRENKMEEQNLKLVDKFPEIKIPNKIFRNKGELLFSDLADSIGNDKASYSNSVIYADLDNDGDLDVVTNNIDDPVLLYENKSNDKKDRPYAAIKLKGPAKNSNALSAKIILFANGGIQVYENSPVHGYQSSMQLPMHVGLHNVKIDSAFLIWPDNSYEAIQLQAGQQSFTYKAGLPFFDYAKITSFYKNETAPAEDISTQVQLNYKHNENFFVEFDREPLIPHMISTEGPAMAVGDINNDGLQDVFIGASRTFQSGIFLQQPNGKFERTPQPAMRADSLYEDVDAAFADVNKDGFADLVIASGGNQYYGKEKYMLPRVYINDGKAQFGLLENAISNIYETTSCVAPYDFNGDGNIDLFVGGRTVPWAYGKIPESYLLLNDGKGKFTDVTAQYAKELSKIGMVTQAAWADLDKDGDNDLIVCCEWGGITAFVNNKGTFTKKVLTDKKGWWNFILPYDTDGDGDLDLIAGNLGLNSRLKASDQQPVNLYYNDYDDNGKSEQLVTYFLGGKEIVFANKSELQQQMPGLKKKFLYAEDFAKSAYDEIVPKEKIKSAESSSANYFSSVILVNNGNLDFALTPLPWKAQLTTLRDAVPVQANNDNLTDFLLVGNYYDNGIQMGRADADFGTILVNKGKNVFSCETLNGLTLKGQVRHAREIQINKQPAYIVAYNNDSTRVIRFRK